MSAISEEMIAAYVDGELSDEDAALVEQARSTDPELRAAIVRYEALRAEIGDAFAPIMNAPPPERLKRIVASPVDRPSERRRRLKTGRANVDGHARAGFSWRGITTMAASLTIGVAIGAVLTPNDANEQVEWAADWTPTAMRLSADLETAPSGVVSETFTVETSYESAEGRFCRTFHVGARERLEGLACRYSDDDWRIAALAPMPPEGAFLPAGENATGLDSYLADFRALSPDEESTLLRSGWAAEQRRRPRSRFHPYYMTIPTTPDGDRFRVWVFLTNARRRRRPGPAGGKAPTGQWRKWSIDC